MTSTDLALRDRQIVTLANAELKFIAGTEFVQPGLRNNLPAILACVATGRALGLPDMVSLRSIHIIDGKASYSAELMVMLARQRGHSITGTVSDGTATITGKRADNGDEMSVTWTLAMAERAGLLNKQNWRKYPEAMLWARAASQLCRMLFPDCFAGATYTTEELGAEVTDEHGAALAEGDAENETLEGVVDAQGDHTPPPSASDEATPVDMTDPAIPFGDSPPAPPTPTPAQLRKLNVLVKADLKDVKLDRVYATVGAIRGWSKDETINTTPAARDTDGELHWGPLRDSLSRLEASELIDRLERYAVGREAS